MAVRSCPVCLRPQIVRDNIKTCGSPECIATWRTWSSEMRTVAVKEAATKDEEDIRRKRNLI